MVREATGKLTRNPTGNTGVLFVPAALTLDSAFPFKIPSRVKITITADEKLVIEKVEK